MLYLFTVVFFIYLKYTLIVCVTNIKLYFISYNNITIGFKSEYQLSSYNFRKIHT